MSRFLSVAEYAAHFDVSDDTVRRLIKSGKITAVRVGTQLRIDPAELDRVPLAAETKIAKSG